MTDKKIAFIVGQLGPGGLERQLYYLIDQLVKNDKDIICFVWNYDKNDFYTKRFEKILKNNLIKFSSNISSFRKTVILRNYVYDFNPQVLVSFTTFTNFPAWYSTLFRKTVAVGSVRGSFSKLINHLSVNRILNLFFPKRLLINSRQSIKELNNHFFFKLFKKPQFLQNHIDFEQFNPGTDNKKEIFSISVGNFTKDKRVDRFIDLFIEIKSRGIKVVHHHIGSGAQKKELQKKIKANNLTSMLFLLGHKNNVNQLLKKASIFVHLSEYEGAPNAVVEALASGLPVLTTNCGDVKEYIKSGVSGYIFNDFDVKIITDRYVELYKNPSKIKQMSKIATESVMDIDLKYLKDNFIESLEKIL